MRELLISPASVKSHAIVIPISASGLLYPERNTPIRRERKMIPIHEAVRRVRMLADIFDTMCRSSA